MNTRNTIAAGQTWPDIVSWDNHWIDRMSGDADGLPPEPRDRAGSWLTIVNRARETNDADLMAFAIAQLHTLTGRKPNV